MTSTARRLLTEALTLPDAERADLAAELLASLDGPADSGWDEAWAKEIDRRIDAAQKSGHPGIEWADARREILARLATK